MARLIDLIRGHKLPVRVRHTRLNRETGVFMIEYVNHGVAFGFFDHAVIAEHFQMDTDYWELCPDQPAAPAEDGRAGFRKVKRYMGISVNDPAFHDKTEDALNVNGMNGYVEFDVWVKE